MSPQYALLGILTQQPSYGYDLKHKYDLLFGGEKALAFGQVYATLARLLRDKKIAAADSRTAGRTIGPERKRYAITAKGRAELEAWLQLPDNIHPDAKPILFVKVVTAILLDTAPNDYLDAQRTAHIARMRELTELRRGGDLAQSLQADYALFHLEADLRWIDLTSARIHTLTKEIRSEHTGHYLKSQ